MKKQSEPELICVSVNMNEKNKKLCFPDTCEPDDKCQPNNQCGPDECGPRYE